MISDLVTDQRVNKVSLYLVRKGCDVLLVGREFNDSPALPTRGYKTARLKCYFRKGILQYAEFNLRLFFYLLFNKADIYVSNDLDTLVPNYILSVTRHKPLVYDSHEYFTGQAELSAKPFKKKIWRLVEQMILPRLKYAYTVNRSISELYKKEFGIDMKVVRNLPLKRNSADEHCDEENNDLPSSKKILVMQGAGINYDRGYEEAVLAMQWLPDDYLLVIIGDGLILPKLKEMVSKAGLESKVKFIARVPYEKLYSYTSKGYLGLSLDKPGAINNTFSLPNKLFDYIHAGIPVLTTSLPELERIVRDYKVGTCIDANDLQPGTIASAIAGIESNPGLYQEWKKNTCTAAQVLNWENESFILDEVYGALLQ